jgi:hypothetical protein
MMNRRDLLRNGIAAATSLALPARAFAQVNPTWARDAELLRIAREQVARAGAKLWHRDKVAIADFGLHSARQRFHFVVLIASFVHWRCVDDQQVQISILRLRIPQTD